MEVRTTELSEAVRLMQTASSLAGSWRREAERKSAETFWRSIGISARGEPGELYAARLAMPLRVGLVGRQAK